jgi:hypothetical protein
VCVEIEQQQKETMKKMKKMEIPKGNIFQLVASERALSFIYV